MEIVLYDEIEKFRNYDHPQFQYPYELRKVALSEFDFNLKLEIPRNGINYDYDYKDDNVDFRISQVCLESPYYDQINIFKAVFNKLKEVWSSNFNSENTSEDSEVLNEAFECENEYFQKMKYQNYKAGITTYDENFDKGIITDRILYQLTLA